MENVENGIGIYFLDKIFQIRRKSSEIIRYVCAIADSSWLFHICNVDFSNNNGNFSSGDLSIWFSECMVLLCSDSSQCDPLFVPYPDSSQS